MPQGLDYGLVIAISSRLLFTKDLRETAHLVSELGFQGLEVWAEHFWRDDDGRLAEGLSRFPLKLYLHGPIADLNIASRNKKIARVSLEENLRAIRLAAELGAELVIVHPGKLSFSKDDPKDYWPVQIEAMGRLVEEAEAHDLRIAVENMDNGPREFMNKPEALSELLEEISSDGIGICLDLAHANSMGLADEFVQELADRIIHIHLSSSDKHTVHLPLFKGKPNLSQTVKNFLRRYRGGITIEGRDPGDEVHVVKEDRRAIEIILKEVVGPEKGRNKGHQIEPEKEGR